MSKTLKYVKDFDFSSAGKTVGYYKGGCVKKADGGMVAKVGRQEAAVMKSRMIPEGSGMVGKTIGLGMTGNKNPGIKGSKPVAPKSPMLKPYKKGGEVGIPENDMRSSNKGGAMRGLERAAAMSGRVMPTPGARPDMTALELAAAKSGRAMPTTGGRPEMKKGGGVKKYAFGGVVPSNVNLPTQAVRPVAPNAPLLPVQANPMAAGRMPMYKKGGAVKKYAAGGAPSTGLARAAEMSGRTMPTPGKPMKSGGAVPKAGAYKVPKVMTEFKAGELHSGSKTGPVVKSRKQAVAIALSEARAAGKKK